MKLNYARAITNGSAGLLAGVLGGFAFQGTFQAAGVATVSTIPIAATLPLFVLILGTLGASTGIDQELDEDDK